MRWLCLSAASVWCVRNDWANVLFSHKDNSKCLDKTFARAWNTWKVILELREWLIEAVKSNNSNDDDDMNSSILYRQRKRWYKLYRIYKTMIMEIMVNAQESNQWHKWCHTEKFHSVQWPLHKHLVCKGSGNRSTFHTFTQNKLLISDH